MPDRHESYKFVKVVELMTGDVIVEGCMVESCDCEGVHERLVRELISLPHATLAITQDDTGELVAEVRLSGAELRVLHPRPKKPMRRLSDEELGLWMSA